MLSVMFNLTLYVTPVEQAQLGAVGGILKHLFDAFGIDGELCGIHPLRVQCIVMRV